MIHIQVLDLVYRNEFINMYLEDWDQIRPVIAMLEKSKKPYKVWDNHMALDKIIIGEVYFNDSWNIPKFWMKADHVWTSPNQSYDFPTNENLYRHGEE